MKEEFIKSLQKNLKPIDKLNTWSDRDLDCDF